MNVVAVAIASVLLSASVDRPLYVSPTGSDTEGNGTSVRPFASIDRARAFRQSRGWNAAMTADAVVNLAPGTYYSTKAAFTAADSAAAGHAIHYANTGSAGAAILDGGILLPDSCWTVVSGSEYRCLIPLNYKPWTLYENGVRATTARLPKLSVDKHYATALAPYFTAAGVDQSPTVLQYDPADFTPTSYDLTRLRLKIWVVDLPPVQIAWFTDTATPASVNTSTHQFTITNPDGLGLKFYPYDGVGARYLIEGDASLVTQAGEFAVSGPYVYYISRSGGAPSGVTLPTTMDIVSIVGADQSTRVSGLSFEGLAIQDADANSWYRFSQPINFNNVLYQNYQQQNAGAQHGAVLISNADHVGIYNAHIKNTGLAGVFLEGYAQQITVAHGLIEHTGTDGIYGDGPPPGNGDIQNHNTFADLIIRRFAELNIGFGIHLNQSGSNTLGPGECYLGMADCIGLTGWLDVSPLSGMYTHDNMISGWRIHDAVQDTGDRGAVKFEFMSRTGTNTLIQSTINGVYAHPSMLDAQTISVNGVFSDNQTDGQTMTNVLVSNTQGALERNNDNGAGPIVTNCSFKADGTVNSGFDETQMNYSAIGPTSSNPYVATAAYTFFDGFENGFGNWTTDIGSPVISTDQAHDGTHSVKQGAGAFFYMDPGQRVYGHFEIWLYDTGDNVDAMASPDELTYNTGTGDFYDPSYTFTNYAAVGIWPGGSTSFYSFWIDRAGTVTTVPRSVGWHHLLWDASTGGAAQVSIDGTSIGTVPLIRAISQVRIGDLQNLGHAGNAYWDGARFF